LTGAIVVTPVILAYSAFAYRVFRGKTPEKGWE
jgi:cytochrome d ubiquinol oxidase subunit II